MKQLKNVKLAKNNLQCSCISREVIDFAAKISDLSVARCKNEDSSTAKYVDCLA
jgi:hypothetical protein